MENWKKHAPIFEYRSQYDDRMRPWAGHVFFVYDLVRNIRPGKIVELGTQQGTSFYSILQAIKDSELNSEAYAVDSWEGDEHAVYDSKEGSKFYQFVSNTIREYYGSQNARLMKMLFDEAVAEFDDNSIDLLHIDGLHTYEAVSHDYNTWKGKLKQEAIVLFHDTQVADDDFGVWKFWKELKENEKGNVYIEFKHSYGLGVLFRGEKYKELAVLLRDKEREFNTYYSNLFERGYKHSTRFAEVEVSLHRAEEQLKASQKQADNLRKELKKTTKALNETREELNMTEVQLASSKAKYRSLVSRKYMIPYRFLMKVLGKEI
jgi:hypothetical protein